MIWRKQIEEENEDGRKGIEENDDNIMDADVINHSKETFLPEEVISRLDDDYDYYENTVAPLTKKLRNQEHLKMPCFPSQTI